MKRCNPHPLARITPLKHTSFGMLMKERVFESGNYRYGFNSQEKVDEVAGSGNINTAEYWEYDTRLGRRWNLDPKTQISMSDYVCLGNNPITYIDPNGDYKKTSITKYYTKNNEFVEKKWFNIFKRTTKIEKTITIYNAKAYNYDVNATDAEIKSAAKQAQGDIESLSDTYKKYYRKSLGTETDEFGDKVPIRKEKKQIVINIKFDKDIEVIKSLGEVKMNDDLIVFANSSTIEKMSGRDKAIGYAPSNCLMFLSYQNRTGKTAFNQPLNAYGDYDFTALHEIGHQGGLYHSKSGIMSEDGGPTFKNAKNIFRFRGYDYGDPTTQYEFTKLKRK